MSYGYQKEEHRKAVLFFLVDLKGFEPTTLRMRTVRSRKVVSFLPMDCGVWYAKIDYAAFAETKFAIAFSIDL